MNAFMWAVFGLLACYVPLVVVVMRGREMQGWLRVDAEGVRTKRQLEPWVKRGVTYARSLPPKR